MRDGLLSIRPCFSAMIEVRGQKIRDRTQNRRKLSSLNLPESRNVGRILEKSHIGKLQSSHSLDEHGALPLSPLSLSWSLTSVVGSLAEFWECPLPES